MDYSTINLDKLRTLPTFTLPPGFRLQEGSGNGCAGDAPGYPTYFTRSVYTRYGASPRYGPQTVITHNGAHYIVATEKTTHEKEKELLRSLWLPLPLGDERVRLWIRDAYRHHNSCYNGWGDDMEIYPVPDYRLPTFGDSPHWSAARRAENEEKAREILARVAALATPENHNAVRLVSRFYPGYQPEPDLISSPPREAGPYWWETEATNPGPERCTETQRHGGRAPWRHPINKTWCQWCGWKQGQ